MRVIDFPVGGWYDYRGKLYQRMRNLNGSNAYCFTDGEYAYIEPTTKVIEALPPRHTACDASKLTHIIHLYENNTFRVEGL